MVRTKQRLRLLGIKRLDSPERLCRLSVRRTPSASTCTSLMTLLKKRPDNFRLTPDQSLRINLPEAVPGP